MVEWIIDVTAYLWLVWLVIVLTAVVIELLTLEFTFLMIAAGSLIGGLGTNLLGASWWVQVAAAAVVTALLLFTIRPVLWRLVGKNDPVIPTNVDALAGMSGVAVSDFVSGVGSVKLANGETWTAKLADVGEDAGPGRDVSVVRVEGATIVVSPSVVLREDV
jgi:membrane protein implicated in regulation of membrane protease activity